LGTNGFLQHLKPDALWIDCSTLNPTFVKEISQHAQDNNIRYLEAPVAGTKPQAEAGSLIFFVGGHSGHMVEVDTYLQMMGQKSIHIGEVGKASSLKLVVNLMLATSMATFAEGIAFGEALGISQEQLFNVLIGGPVTPPYLASKRGKLEKQDYSPQFPLKWMHKDLQMVALAAYENDVPMPLAHATKELYAQAIKSGHGDQDLAAIYEYLSG
ncbi:MAG: NAD(P)-dependent oxidoreductase, partial [Chloroflexota bacterium]